MSFLGKITSIINPWARQEASGEIVKLIDAQLFHVAPVKGKMARKLVFPKAEAIVRRTGQDFQYQLAVTRTYDAGERELIREAAETAGDYDALLDDAEEKTFLLDEGMGFNKVVEGGASRALVTFTWFDMDDVDSWNANVALRPRFELLVELNNEEASDGQVNKVKIEEFETDVWRACWERKFKKRALENPELVAEWTRKHVMLGAMGPASAPGTPTKTGFQPAPRTPASAASAATSFKTPASSTKSAVFDDAETPSPTPASKPSAKIHPLPALRTLPPGTVISESPAELYQFQAHVSQFILIRHQVKACLVKANAFQYWMVIRSHDDVDLISQEVEERMNPIFSTQDKAFVWCYYDDDEVYSWALKFAEVEMEESWRKTFQACLWEVANESPFNKLKEEDQQYVLDGAGLDAQDLDIQMGEIGDMLDEIDQFVDAGSKAWDEKVKKVAKAPKPTRVTRSTAARPIALSSEDEPDTTESESESDPEIEYGNEETEEANRQLRSGAGATSGEKNSNLAVGHVSDRTFVVRGNRIGVFKYGEENSLQFVTSINQVLKSKTGETPPKIMLHGQDKSLLLLDSRDEHRIQRMDLERGEVVETWKVHDSIGVEEIAPDTKFSQQTVEQTLLGMSHNALFRIDPRLSGDKIVMSEMKQYSTKQGFTCTATDSHGHIVVGSSKGEIRMFDSVGKMAKNLLPGFGERIIGIDVTASGEWILATCKDYLLLIHNVTKTTSGTATGFTQRMSKESRAQPRKLKILPQHVAFMGGPINFTPAKFNVGDSDEQTIVTSTGPFVVTWNFRQVKNGRYHDYTIKRYNETVVTDNFKYADPRAVIVALPNDVTMVSQSQMLTPKQLLSTPAHKRASKNNIVNSPY